LIQDKDQRQKNPHLNQQREIRNNGNHFLPLIYVAAKSIKKAVPMNIRLVHATAFITNYSLKKRGNFFFCFGCFEYVAMVMPGETLPNDTQNWRCHNASPACCQAFF